MGHEVDDAARGRVFRESGGNPFYIEQLARAGDVEPVRGSAAGERVAGRSSPDGDRRDPQRARRGLADWRG